MALTSDACHKGLPKSPTGEIPQFKGNLILVYRGSHWSFTTTSNCTSLVAVGEGQAHDETLATGAAVAAETPLSWRVTAGSDGCASLMDGSSSLLAQLGC